MWSGDSRSDQRGRQGMKLTSSATQARVAYAVLLIISIPIPLFHYRVLGDTLWAIRYPWGLHPVPLLILWNLGWLSAAIPAILLALFFASWKWNRLCVSRAPLLAALGVCLFTTMYGTMCAMALWLALGR